MSNIILISIIIAICLFFLVNMIDKSIIEQNDRLDKINQVMQCKVDTLFAIIREIKKELKLTQLKECPPEELKQIPKEIIEWIEILETGDKMTCQKENEE